MELSKSCQISSFEFEDVSCAQQGRVDAGHILATAGTRGVTSVMTFEGNKEKDKCYDSISGGW